MEPRESFRDVENLRFRFQMNNRLRLECLAAVSKVFRDFEEPIADDLLASVIFALPQELVSANGNGNGNGHAYKAEAAIPPESPKEPGVPPESPTQPGVPPESPEQPGIPPEAPEQLPGVPPEAPLPGVPPESPA